LPYAKITPAPGEPINTIVALDLDGPNPDGGTVLCSGADFYSTPELSASGRLAWVEWHHPNMPWDSTAIMTGFLSGAVITTVRLLPAALMSRPCNLAGSMRN
jgi:hypothetical protein